MFTTAVANIGPRETISIEIQYQHLVDYTAGRFELRFPLVVGPRFIPGAPSTTRFSGNGWAENTVEVPYAARITPPVARPGQPRLNPVSIHLDLNLSIALDEINSPFHAIKVLSEDDYRYQISLAAKETPADRDFIICFRPRLGEEPTAALFTEEHDGYEYALLMLMPPQIAGAVALPRKIMFVIDTSGSMAGSSIRQAKRALAVALAQLGPTDLFNLIQFNSRTSSLYAQPIAVSETSLREGRAYIDQLEAGGGTLMAPALALAFAQAPDGRTVSQIVFITDGNVGNEDALFGLIKSRLGDSRLFTIGISSAPNSHFMRGAARYGRGSFTYIGAVAEVQPQMDKLFDQITSPMLHDIDLSWGAAAAVEAWPRRIPDLYRGEPVMVVVRAKKLPAAVTVSGRIAGRDWHAVAELRGGQGRRGVHVLWARRKIEALMDRAHEHVGDKSIREAVVEIALAHHLASRYTNLIAVDATPARPKRDRVKGANVPTNLPAGWDHARVFGRLPRTAALSRPQMLLGIALMLLAMALLLVARRLRHDG